ncbi:elongation factor P [Oenococcus kitaharae]|uniref:elongation factor P n=1 Tax=Oenococcus TaxID=46254 RepID=UPI0021E845AD|nr:elongation factor P [Oenococcus kitaharae]MCV3296057.1 elongation factor P [Oenococcus kitaharae]
MAIDTSDFKNGLTIEYNKAIWRILSFQHVKPGKGGAFVRSKLKNLRTGAVNEVTFRAGERMELADITTRPMQYLYANGDSYVFMDTETYDQLEIPGEKIKDSLKFLLENMEVRVTSYHDEILDVELPVTVELTVTDTQPSIKGATVNGGGKPATMETGLVITVPDFINAGDKLVVNTADGGSYKERA